MTKFLTAAFLACGLLASPAYAQKMDCEAQLEAAQAALSAMKTLSPGARAARARIAQHAYDLCMVGDEPSAKKYFEMMRASSS
jgi:type II secretory pathway component PulM